MIVIIIIAFFRVCMRMKKVILILSFVKCMAKKKNSLRGINGMENLSSKRNFFFSHKYLILKMNFSCVWIPSRIPSSFLLLWTKETYKYSEKRRKLSTATNFYVNEGEEKRNWIGKNERKKEKIEQILIEFLKKHFIFFSFSLSLFNFSATHIIGAEIFLSISNASRRRFSLVI